MAQPTCVVVLLWNNRTAILLFLPTLLECVSVSDVRTFIPYWLHQDRTKKVNWPQGYDLVRDEKQCKHWKMAVFAFVAFKSVRSYTSFIMQQVSDDENNVILLISL